LSQKVKKSQSKGGGLWIEQISSKVLKSGFVGFGDLFPGFL